MNSEKSKSKKVVAKEATVRRTSISETGKITESEIPLSSLKTEAIDLSAESKSPTTLFLTRDAAMRITEHAISTALDHAWSKLVVDSQTTQTGEAMSKPKRTIDNKTNKQIPHTKRNHPIGSKNDVKDNNAKTTLQHSPKKTNNGDKNVKVETNSAPVIGSNPANKSKSSQQPIKETKRSASSPSPGSSKKRSKGEEGGSTRNSGKLID